VRAHRHVSALLAVLSLGAVAPAVHAAAWSAVASPNPSGGQDVLNDVGRLPGTKVLYAVGRTNNGTLVLRSENAGKSWHVEPAPSPGSGAQLLGVSVRERGVWAVGYRAGPRRTTTLTIRRKGGTWRVVSSPNPAASDFLYDVVTTTAGTWAVGAATGRGGAGQPLVLRWSGSKWKVQRVPSLPKGDNRLFGVAANGGKVWALGERSKGSAPLHPLALHRTRSGWHVSNAPDPARGGESFFLDGAFSGKTLWAVGGRGAGSAHALAERHTPGGWRAFKVPDACPVTNTLAAVVPIPGTKQLWAVGDCSPGLGNRTLVAKRRNGVWTHIKSPTPDTSGSFLTGVVAFSKARAAAVGYRTPAGFRTIALIYR
jgi:hypothetical protein